MLLIYYDKIMIMIKIIMILYNQQNFRFVFFFSEHVEIQLSGYQMVA